MESVEKFGVSTFSEEKFGNLIFYKLGKNTFIFKKYFEKISLRYSSSDPDNAQIIFDEFCNFKKDEISLINDFTFDNCYFEKINLTNMFKNSEHTIKITFLHTRFERIIFPNNINIELFIYDDNNSKIVDLIENVCNVSIKYLEITCQKINANNLWEIETILEKSGRHELQDLYFFNNYPRLSGRIYFNGEFIKISRKKAEKMFPIKYFRSFISYSSDICHPYEVDFRKDYYYKNRQLYHVEKDNE